MTTLTVDPYPQSDNPECGEPTAWTPGVGYGVCREPATESCRVCGGGLCLSCWAVYPEHVTCMAHERTLRRWERDGVAP